MLSLPMNSSAAGTILAATDGDWHRGLEAYRRWRTMQEPTWANVQYPKIDFQDLYYYAAPKST